MKLGLVLEGGASRAYFSVGVMDCLMEEQIFADCVVGASAGIANGLSYVSRQIGRSLKIGLEYLPDKRYMGAKHLLNPKNKSYYNISFVFDDIPNKYVYFDYETYRKNADNVYAAVTNLQTGQCEYLHVSGEDKAWTPVVASCALPILFQPIAVGGALYMDGGIANAVPVEKAFEEGCDKVIVVTTREKTYVKEKESALGIAEFLYRKYPNFKEALTLRTQRYNESYQTLIELEKQGKIFWISPEQTDGWRRTEADPKKLKEMFDAGVAITKQQMRALKTYLQQ